MTKFAPLLAFLLTPGIASAHPGHDHLGNEVTHHTLEALVAVAAIAITWRVLARVRSNKTAPTQHED